MIRHVSNIKLYVVIIISTLYAGQTVDIPLDPIYHNNYYLDNIYPGYQADFISKDYVVFGNFGYPVSTYSVKDLYTSLNDSVRTNSSLLYEQGDVGYRNLYIDIKTKIEDTGTLKLLANGLSFPGRFSQYSEDNILQNYLLHFSKKYENSLISIYAGYHLENKDLKYINSKSGESYFYGIYYDLIREKYEFGFKYASQIGQLIHPLNIDVDYSTFNLKYNFIDNMGIYFDYILKTWVNTFDSNGRHNRSISGLGTSIGYKKNHLDIGIKKYLVDSDYHPEINFTTTFDCLSFNVGLSSKVFDRYFENFQKINYSFFSISFLKNNFHVKIKPVKLSEVDKYSINNEMEVNFEILESETMIIPYLFSLNKTNISLSLISNHYNSNDLIVKNHIESLMTISELQSTRRYRKFFEVKYIGLQFNQLDNINSNQFSNYNLMNNWIWNDNSFKNYLDLSLGVKFEKFIFSWHFTNVLSENYMINKDGNIYNLNMSYFTVQWNFDN